MDDGRIGTVTCDHVINGCRVDRVSESEVGAKLTEVHGVADPLLLAGNHDLRAGGAAAVAADELNADRPVQHISRDFRGS